MRGWRTLGLVILGGFLLLLLASLLAWLAVLITALAGLAALHLVFLPRLSSRLRVSPFALCLLLLPVLTAVGWALGGREGLLVAAVLWLAGFALPRLAIRRLGRTLSRGLAVRVGSTQRPPRSGWGPTRALEAAACRHCGLVSLQAQQAGDAACTACGAALRPSQGSYPHERS